MRVIYKDNQRITIMEARRPTECELKQFADWARPLMLYGIPGSTDINLPHITWRDMPERKSEGMFPGCDNCAWIISPEDEQRYITLESERAGAEQAKRDTARVASDERRKALITKGKAEGKPQVLHSWITEECTEHLIDCSFDRAVELIDEHGTITRRYTHCY